MQIGIIGMPMVGKTTIFQLLTNTIGKTAAIGKTNTAMARIPDYRVDSLSEYYHPKKTTYAQLEVVDIPGLLAGGDKSSAVFLDAIRQADALLMVVQAFNNDQGSSIKPIENIETINYELLLADLDLIEKRIQRINENKKRRQMEKDRGILIKLKEAIENEKHISSVPLDEEEQEIMRTYQFLTTKPILVCINIDEKNLADKNYPGRGELISYLAEHNLDMVEVSAEIEKEIAELEGEDKNYFMKDLGITEPGLVKIARGIYERLGLISFLTCGEDEVKAWTIRKGTIAKNAAGKIHSDIERGFIRAEVINYQDFEEWGSMPAVKEKGLFRLEGKEYPIKDGDIIHFRFNV